MIIDAAAFSERSGGAPTAAQQAVATFLSLLESKLGGRVVFDKRDFPSGRPELEHLGILAGRLIDAGVIRVVHERTGLPDEPRMKLWVCDIAGDSLSRAGGASLSSHADALAAALSEALERHVWREEIDYFTAPMVCSARELAVRNRAFVDPATIVGYSKAQRRAKRSLQFDDDTKFLFVAGCSLTTGKRTLVPAQLVSAAPLRDPVTGEFRKEPLIRSRTTNGLATWPTRTGARLAGMLELVERDAYMIMWLNQLTLPRLDLDDVSVRYASVAHLIDYLARYGLVVHIIPLLTDAPTHALCAVVEDTSGQAPRFSVGLKAHRLLPHALEKAVGEALRARAPMRSASPEAAHKDVHDIGHYDRLDYWAAPDNAHKLEFLVAGETRPVEQKPWESDTEEQHYARMVAWLRLAGMECVSVPLTRSRKNVSGLHIEMTLIPALQPVHLSEKALVLGGERWHRVPEMFGFEARDEMFTSEPHPFA